MVKVNSFPAPGEVEKSTATCGAADTCKRRLLSGPTPTSALYVWKEIVAATVHSDSSLVLRL